MLNDLIRSIEKEFWPKYEFDGALLKFWIDKRQLTQSKFSEKIGINNSHISEYVNNKRVPSIKILTQMAEALGVMPTDFLSRQEII